MLHWAFRLSVLKIFTTEYCDESFIMLQLVRYGLVGLASNVIAYLIYLLITYLGVNPKLAVTLVYISGAFVGFVANKRWTFNYDGKRRRILIRFVVAHSLSYSLSMTLFYFMVDYLGYPHQYAQALIIIIVAGNLFLLFKYFVFASKQDKA